MADGDDKDAEVLRSAADIFKKHGVRQTSSAETAKPPDTPKVEKDSFEQRAKVKDLGQDQGRRPEGVHQEVKKDQRPQQEMGWAERIIASRQNTAQQGMSRGGGGSENSSERTGASQPQVGLTSWTERVIASRPQGYGHGKVEGAETDAQGKAPEKTAKVIPEKDKGKDAKPKAQAQSKAKSKAKESQNDSENER